jgi:hypothetical protein
MGLLMKKEIHKEAIKILQRIKFLQRFQDQPDEEIVKIIANEIIVYLKNLLIEMQCLVISPIKVSSKLVSKELMMENRKKEECQRDLWMNIESLFQV